MDAMEKREKLVHNKCGRDSWSSPQDDVETRGGSIIGLRQAKSPANLTNMVQTVAMTLHLKPKLGVERVCQTVLYKYYDNKF